MQQRRSRIGLPFGRDVLGDRVDSALDQHALDGVGVNIALADEADRLGEDVHRVGSIGGHALYPADQIIYGSIGAVWHVTSMAGPTPTVQPLGGRSATGFHLPSAPQGSLP